MTEYNDPVLARALQQLSGALQETIKRIDDSTQPRELNHLLIAVDNSVDGIMEPALDFYDSEKPQQEKLEALGKNLDPNHGVRILDKCLGEVRREEY